MFDAVCVLVKDGGAKERNVTPTEGLAGHVQLASRRGEVEVRKLGSVEEDGDESRDVACCFLRRAL